MQVKGKEEYYQGGKDKVIGEDVGDGLVRQYLFFIFLFEGV